MGETKESTWHLLLQFSSSEIDLLKHEINLLDKALNAARLLILETGLDLDDVKYYQTYRGALVRLASHRVKIKKRNSILDHVDDDTTQL